MVCSKSHNSLEVLYVLSTMPTGLETKMKRRCGYGRTNTTNVTKRTFEVWI